MPNDPQDDPQQTKLRVPDVLSEFKAYYKMPGNGAGGSLHLVLDDQNTEDSSVDFCIQFAAQRGDNEGERLGRLLRQMSRTQRLKISRLIY